MGASGSLLMATIVLESFIPDKCWMAPEIPAFLNTYNEIDEEGGGAEEESVRI